MKTVKTNLILAVAALALVTAPVAASKPLKRHAKGPSVARLQRALHLVADGKFGVGTSRAVKHFQRRHHLPVDGVVGPATWRMIRHAQRHHATSARTGTGIAIQTRGSSVRLLQRRLGIDADGVFGPGTSRAVKTFQRAHGLTADGLVGPATWGALGVGGRHPILRRAHLHGRAATSNGLPLTVLRAILAGNRIATLPYIYGGGHGSFTASGYDCSGSVSYVLHGAGLLDRPEDSGELMSYGAPGPGRWITIYANAGHAYMTVGSRRYDTSARYTTGGSRWTHAGRSSAGYVVRHPPGF
jgi:lysozyme family protein